MDLILLIVTFLVRISYNSVKRKLFIYIWTHPVPAAI